MCGSARRRPDNERIFISFCRDYHFKRCCLGAVKARGNDYACSALVGILPLLQGSSTVSLSGFTGREGRTSLSFCLYHFCIYTFFIFTSFVVWYIRKRAPLAGGVILAYSHISVQWVVGGSQIAGARSPNPGVPLEFSLEFVVSWVSCAMRSIMSFWQSQKFLLCSPCY